MFLEQDGKNMVDSQIWKILLVTPIAKHIEYLNSTCKCYTQNQKNKIRVMYLIKTKNTNVPIYILPVEA